jgi:lipid A 3-O-deacylase
MVPAKLSFLSLFLVLVLLLHSLPSSGEEGGRAASPRKGVSVEAGNTYDPGTGTSFVLGTGLLLWNYGEFWNQDRPPELSFKVEAAAGAAVRPKVRAMASLGMAALYHLDFLRTGGIRPYAEAGIGIIYTDFRVPGQGLRLNFNPQLGIGMELQSGSGQDYFAALRLHHLSNAGLDDQNRGMNSLVLQVGRFF